MLRNLVAMLGEADRSAFPNHANYYARYLTLEEYLSNNVHNDVVLGAITHDGGLLNDHGPGHIRTVIDRAGAMLSGENKANFTPYEIYLLLCAIHFHDVGNVFGRDRHEQRLVEVMREVRPILGNDATEFKCIGKIANAHGGKANGDRDKIAQLENDPVNGKDVDVRALAAVLRFADELADDKHRANRYLLAKGLIPEESEVFHKYAASLDSVMVRPNEGTIDLRFNLLTDDARRLWGKKAKNSVEKVFIIDEIYTRTLKMHMERTYCSRFMRSYVDLSQIDARIEIFDEADSIEPARKKIEYRLEERGYPGDIQGGIHSLCGALQTGRELADSFSVEAA